MYSKVDLLQCCKFLKENADSDKITVYHLVIWCVLG